MMAHPTLRSRVQRGIGLVEVMIALTIGIVLLMGVGQYFISMRQTASAAQKLSALQNQQRMAMYFLHVAVAGAGNTPDPANTSAAVLYPSNTKFPAVGQTLYGLGPTAGTTLRTRFTASNGGSQQGCSATLVAGNVYTDEFSVSNGYLVCVETNETAGTTKTVQLIGDPVNQVSSMSIRYGVDTTTSTTPNVSIVPLSAVQYLTGDQMTTALWPFVMTVEITLQFTDPMAGQFGRASTATIPLTETIPYMSNV